MQTFFLNGALYGLTLRVVLSMKTVFFIGLFLWLSGGIGSVSFAQLIKPRPSHVPGTATAKPVKEKKPKIKYNVHEGVAYLKTGLIIRGKFFYTDLAGQVPEYSFVEEGSKGRKSVSLSMIDRLVLAGAEEKLGARTDSTEFVWIEKFKDLYRKIRTGTIEIYDNSRVVNEEYDFIPNYFMVAGRAGYDFKFIKQVSDLIPLMVDRPYFTEVLQATGRAESKDYRIMFYLTDLFNEPNPMQMMNWDTLQVTFKDGSSVMGRGYIQPLDIRNEHINTPTAYIHFHDGHDFKLFTQNDIAFVTTGGKVYQHAYYVLTNKHFWGVPWQYNGEAYMVTRRILSSNNFYYRYRANDNLDLTILKENGTNGYIKPIDEATLKQAYLAGR